MIRPGRRGPKPFGILPYMKFDICLVWHNRSPVCFISLNTWLKCNSTLHKSHNSKNFYSTKVKHTEYNSLKITLNNLSPNVSEKLTENMIKENNNSKNSDVNKKSVDGPQQIILFVKTRFKLSRITYFFNFQ